MTRPGMVRVGGRRAGSKGGGGGGIPGSRALEAEALLSPWWRVLPVVEGHSLKHNIRE